MQIWKTLIDILIISSIKELSINYTTVQERRKGSTKGDIILHVEMCGFQCVVILLHFSLAATRLSVLMSFLSLIVFLSVGVLMPIILALHFFLNIARKLSLLPFSKKHNQNYADVGKISNQGVTISPASETAKTATHCIFTRLLVE